MSGTSASAPAASSEEVTTVSLLPGRIVVAIASATSWGVMPSSM